MLFQLAVDHGMGGPDSQAKAEWMVTAVDQWFKENGKIFISTTVVPTKCDSDVMFCLHRFQDL